MKRLVTPLWLIIVVIKLAAVPAGFGQQPAREAVTGLRDTVRSDSQTRLNERQKDERIIKGLLQMIDVLIKEEVYEEALLLYEATLSILGKTYGPANPRVCDISRKYVELLRRTGKEAEADQVPLCEQR